MKFTLLGIIGSIALTISLHACSENQKLEKGFPLTESIEDDHLDEVVIDSVKILTQPGDLLLTANPNIRLNTVFKIERNKKHQTLFWGSNAYHSSYYDDEETRATSGNIWNGHLIPGFEAVYGYNMVNVSLANLSAKTTTLLFEKPTLIKTLYFPSALADTLAFKPVNRKFMMLSVYNQDTNRDGFLNTKDLRRFLWFDLDGQLKGSLIPDNYSVFKSTFDDVNDYLFVYARLDQNKDGSVATAEPIHLFWIDLNNPENRGRSY